jgi:hypothetical protein
MEEKPMFAQVARFNVTLLSVVLLASLARPAFAAPPGLFYSLLPLNHSQETCMKRALATISSEVKGGKLDKRVDNVSLVNDDFNIGVHCRDTGKNKSFATIVVAHRSSFDEARGVALNIRRGMETGINN